jgi:hypothetical protein
MNNRTEKRRKNRAPFYDDTVDRREAIDRRDQPIVASKSAMPGMIRPGVGDDVPALERRRMPGSGDE